MWVQVLIAFVLFVILRYVVDSVLRFPWETGLHRKCVLVTGCSSGFGKALAVSLYARGVTVFAGCRSEDTARKLREEIGDGLKPVLLDVTSTESIENAFLYVKSNLPPNTVLWGVVNNAGTPGLNGPLEIVSRKDMYDTMNVNCFGVTEMARVFLPLLKQSKGRIVNMCSAAGFMPIPGVFPYVASKYALVGISEAMRHEKKPWGIQVSIIYAGMFATKILEHADGQATVEMFESMDPTTKEEYGKEFFEKRAQNAQKAVKYAPTDLSPVVGAYEHALFAVRPRSEYYPGKDSVLVSCMAQWLPKFAMDKLFASLNNAVLPRALQK